MFGVKYALQVGLIQTFTKYIETRRQNSKIVPTANYVCHFYTKLTQFELVKVYSGVDVYSVF